MTRIAIDTAFQAIEVDFWGAVFETRAMPRSRSRKARVLATRIDELLRSNPESEDVADTEEEELIAKYGELFDLKLKPIEGNRKKASVLLVAKWEDDGLTGEQLASFLAHLTLTERRQAGEALEEFFADPADRPT